MTRFSLTFHQCRFGAAKNVDFEGRSAADALAFIVREPCGQRADLSVSGRHLATLRRAQCDGSARHVEADSFWIVE